MMFYWHEFNNFDDEATMDVLCEKIEIVFKTKNSMNKVLVFRNIVRLRYEDHGSSMVDHQMYFRGWSIKLSP